MRSRLFVSQDIVDAWLLSGQAELTSTELFFVPEGLRFRVGEGAYVSRELSGEGDEHELVACVKTRGYLRALGAELLDRSMVLGSAAYDLVPGWIVLPETHAEQEWLLQKLAQSVDRL